jgi:hypothetical protein
MKRRARELLTLVEERYLLEKRPREDIDSLVFRLDGNGELQVLPLEDKRSSAGGLVQDPKKLIEVDQTIQEIPSVSEEREPRPLEDLQEEDCFDLLSSQFDPKHWPGDASARCHLSSTLSPLASSHLVPRDTARVVYLSIVSHRIEGNAAFAMALWLSEALAIPLDVIVRALLLTPSVSLTL